MGDISEMMEEGILCRCCGVAIITEHEGPKGYPALCDDCAAEEEDEENED